jgi:hypothetical protein
MSRRQAGQRPVRVVAVVIGAWLATASAGGATLHLVIGAITEDGTPRRCTENRWLYNGDRMQELLEANVLPEQLTVTWVPTDPMTPSAVLGVVQALQDVGPDDALMFYYAGHGAYDQQNRQYFHLLPSGQPLYRQTLYEALMRHNPRLMVLISDCCYTFSPSREGPPLLGQAPPPSRLARTSPLFENLFFKTRGVVDLTSAGRDQASYWVGDLTEGSIFGSALRGVLASFKEEELSWRQVVARVRKRTASRFEAVVKKPEPNRLPNGQETPQTTQTPYAFALPGPKLGIRASVAAGIEGLRIDETLGAAREAGLKAGDHLLAVNGKPVRTEDEYYDALLESGESTFELQIADGHSGEKKNVTLRPR